MIRVLQWLNLVGVICLVALSAKQWDINRVANEKADHLESVRLQHVQELADRDKTIAGLHSDLDDFRSRLTLAESQAKALEEKLSQMTQLRDQAIKERDQLASERDMLKKAIGEWVAAVKARDDALKTAGTNLNKLAEQRNDVITQFNGLATRYNQLVQDINASRTTTRPTTGPLP